MRTIKFRAWDKGTKTMAFVDALYSPVAGEFKRVDLFNDSIAKDFGGTIGSRMEDIELMQFTGLLDKNGKEIYEGDIVKIGDDLIEEVKWVNVGNWFGEKQPMVGFISHGTIYKELPEIVGNIYENPELLTN